MRNCASCVVEDCPLEAALLVAFLVAQDGIIGDDVQRRVWPDGWGRFGNKCHEYDPGF